MRRLRNPSPGDTMKLDPVTLAVMNNRLGAIAEEMGVVLGQTGYSPNIKERHDFSCALFDSRGELVAQAAHIPVHLGSTPLSVRAVIEHLDRKSTRLNSSHQIISYAVFCLKKKKHNTDNTVGR